jgi:hypothetical protein
MPPLSRFKWPSSALPGGGPRSHGIRHFKLDAWRSGRPTPLGEAPASGLAAVTLNRPRHGLSFLSCSGELCGVRVIPAVDVAVVQVKAARGCDGWAGWPVRLWVYGGSTRGVPGWRGLVGDRAV